MSTTKHHAAKGGDKTHDFASNVQEFKSSVAQLRTDTAEVVDHAVEAGKSGVMAARETAAAAVDGLKTQGTECAQAIGRRISEKPLVGILIAIGLGFILARALARK